MLLNRSNTRLTLWVTLCLLATIASVPARCAEPRASRRSGLDANAIARSVLAPYRNARSYIGVLTTSRSGPDGDITLAASVFALAGDDGRLIGLREEFRAWGFRAGAPISGEYDGDLIANSSGAWVMDRSAQRIASILSAPGTLSEAMGLPDDSATWTFAPKIRDDRPTERRLISRDVTGDTSLVYDSSTLHLMRVERRAGRTRTTSAIHDNAMDDPTFAQRARSLFTPPANLQPDPELAMHVGRP